MVDNGKTERGLDKCLFAYKNPATPEPPRRGTRGEYVTRYTWKDFSGFLERLRFD